MTIDKAKSVINELKLYVEDLHSYSADEVAEALDMAIQVLEQQPCEDCISRQAVKEMLREEWTKYIPMELDINLSYVLEKISELPPVTPTITNVKNDFNIGYNCGYTDAMIDIAESEETE